MKTDEKEKEQKEIAEAFLKEYNELVEKHGMTLQAYITELGPKLRIVKSKE